MRTLEMKRCQEPILRRVAVQLSSSSVKRPSPLVRIVQHSPFNIEHSSPHPPLSQRFHSMVVLVRCATKELPRPTLRK